MDTRRLSESNDARPLAPVPIAAADVEIVELTAVEPSRHGFLRRMLFVVAVAVLAGLIAQAGLPSRTSFAFDTPLPNVFTATPAP